MFDRSFFRSPSPITRIGEGELGGKARGLVLIRDLLTARFNADNFPGIGVYVPKMVIIATGVFDAFMERNGLMETALSDLADHQMAELFQRAELPAEILGLPVKESHERARHLLALVGLSGFEDKYLDMLRAGGTKRHKELLAPFGLDASDPSFWQKGLSVISGMIDELESL